MMGRACVYTPKYHHFSWITRWSSRNCKNEGTGQWRYAYFLARLKWSDCKVFVSLCCMSHSSVCMYTTNRTCIFLRLKIGYQIENGIYATWMNIYAYSLLSFVACLQIGICQLTFKWTELTYSIKPLYSRRRLIGFFRSVRRLVVSRMSHSETEWFTTGGS